jgi:hypothetical protein
VIAVFSAMSRSSRVGPGMIRTAAQTDRKIRQSTAKSQVSIMEYSTVWKIGIYQSSRSGLPAQKKIEQKYPDTPLNIRFPS